MDVNNIRIQTPGLEGKIFFNSAGSSLMAQPVYDLLVEYTAKEMMASGYKIASSYQDDVADFYLEAANLLHTEPRNIAFCTSATEGYFKALSSIAFSENDVIVTTDDDYISNFISFNVFAQRFKIKIERIKNLDNGDIDLNHFEDLLSTVRPKVVCITHVPTNSGLIQEVESIGNICHEMNIYYLVDGCQSVGQLDVDVSKINCDFLSATGRKFLRGPRGTGLLYVSDRILDEGLTPLTLDMMGAEWQDDFSIKPANNALRFEMWERNYANLIGLKEAIRYCNSIGIKNIETRNQYLIGLMKNVLSQVGGVEMYDKGSKTSAILTWSKEQKSLADTTKFLDDNHVYYSIARKEFAQYDFTKKEVEWAIRFSPHYFNNEDEINKVGELLSLL